MEAIRERPTPSGLPKRLGPYELIETIGRGGMGTVVLGRDTRLGRPVAIKILDRRHDPGRRRRFEREAKLASSLAHPGIVTVFDIGHDRGVDFLVMEPIDGRSLAERIPASGLASAEAIRIALEIARAMAAAHDAGVIHRDLKPANVMVTASGAVKIVDFGIAKLAEDRERTITETGSFDSGSFDTDADAVVGTLAFMAPEQLLGDPVDARCDLFALGGVLYAMLAGRPPFAAAHPALVAYRILHLDPEALALGSSPADRRLAALVGRLLAKRPADRPSSMAEVVTELEALSRPIESSSQPTNRPPSRWRMTVLAGTFGVVLGAAVLTPAAWMSWTEDRGEPAGYDVEVARPADERWVRYREALARLDRPDVEGSLDRAETTLRALVDEHPDWAAPWAALSRLDLLRYQTAGRDVAHLDRARAAARRAVELDAELALAQAMLGRTLVAAGETEPARAALDLALRLDPNQSEALRGLGSLHVDLGELDAARVIYERAVRLHPEDAGFYDRLGAVCYRQGDDAAAEAAFSRSVELAPDAVYGHRNLAAVYHRQGRIAEAAGALQRALEIRPSATLYTNLGTLLHYQGFYADAARAFEKALAGDGGAHTPLRWANLGDSLRRITGREAEAEDAYRRASQLTRERLGSHPDDPRARSRLALIEARRGRCDASASAVQEIDRAAVVDEGDASTAYRMALAHEACGERAEALDRLGDALRLGFSPAEVHREPELIALRADVEYHRLVADVSPDPTARSPR